MRSVIATVGGLFFVAALGVTPLLAQEFISGCVPQKKNDGDKKNAKLKRVGLGTSPGSACKSNKEVEVTLPTDEITDSLQTQINSNDADIAALQTQAGDNAAMIDNIKAGLISSMIGGGHNNSTDGADTFYMPLYNWFRISDETQASSRVAVTGWLTDLYVGTNEPVGTDASEIFKFVVNGVPIDLDGLIETVCIITGDTSQSCESTGCVKIEQGDTLSVQVLASNSGAVPNVSPTRWTGRFVETDADCPPQAEP